MSKKAVPAPPTAEQAPPSANDHFKSLFESVFWGSMILATVVHFAVFQFWPEMIAADVSFSADELEAIQIPPEIQIPPPPEAIARPATPVIATADINEEITIAPTTFEENPVEDLPPPPSEVHTDIAAAPTFTPYTVKPDIKNREQVRRALEREYPPLLRDAGIGGVVLVWLFIDEEGQLVRTQVHQSSGHKDLDEAALKVANIIEFTPALNRDKRVPVWISLPITFRTE